MKKPFHKKLPYEIIRSKTKPKEHWVGLSHCDHNQIILTFDVIWSGDVSLPQASLLGFPTNRYENFCYRIRPKTINEKYEYCYKVSGFPKTMKYPKINEIYDHYKGGQYKTLYLAKHTTTDEVLVIYQSIHFQSVHARPLNEWFENVEGKEENINNQSTRFTLAK